MTDNVNTIIGKGAVIDGTVSVKGHLRIDGIVKGSVSCDETLTIGADGRVEADIDTKTAIITGAVIGNINAVERLELQTKSLVEGDIKTKSLVVEQGAIFHGSCVMNDKNPQKLADKISK